MFLGFLKRFTAGQPVRVVANARNLSRIANILEDIQGVGLRIQKPTDAEGMGWRIINDGTSDATIPNPPGDEEGPEKKRQEALAYANKAFPIGDKWPWGIYWDGDKATVYNPRMLREPYAVTTVDTEITMFADKPWIGYKLTQGSGAHGLLSVTGPHAREPQTGVDCGTDPDINPDLSGSVADDIVNGIERGGVVQLDISVDPDTAAVSVGGILFYPIIQPRPQIMV